MKIRRLPQNYCAHFIQIWHNESLEDSTKASLLFLGKIKYILTTFIKDFLFTTQPISTKFDINLSENSHGYLKSCCR